MDINKDKERLNEIDRELKKIHDLFDEYHSWYDKKTQKVWFPPGRYFDYNKMVERETELLTERKAITERMKSA